VVLLFLKNFFDKTFKMLSIIKLSFFDLIRSLTIDSNFRAPNDGFDGIPLKRNLKKHPHFSEA
jgi:hypothetical protein